MIMITIVHISELLQLTTDQMREVDRLMIEEWHINLVQMMENAGRNLAELTKVLLGGSLKEKQVVVLCGQGNNGGGGMAAARHLHNWGIQVSVALIGSPDQLKPVPAQQWQSIEKLGIIEQNPDLTTANLIIDAMIGYGLVGDPRPPISDWINKANYSKVDILSLDAPSGLNTTSGLSSDCCIKAKATMTLAMPKTGLLTENGKKCVGELYLADISVPPELYAGPTLNLEPSNPFKNGTIVKILYH
jgi:NAD(P)H-hydrate epimerase